jgi:hypothetical protein
MLDAEVFGQQAMLRLDLVGIVVFRESGAETIRWLRAFAVADIVGNDDVVLRGVEWLAGPVEFAGEGRGEHAGG